LDGGPKQKESWLVIFQNEITCRSCESPDLITIIAFGDTPLADRLLTKEQIPDDDYSAPLTVVFCEDCSLVQIRETVAPEVLFYAEYPYFSSVSKSLLKHFSDSAHDIIEDRNLNSNSFVVEAASNDGYMLRNFAEQGIKVLGIEPTDGPAQVAMKLGIETRQMFFTSDVAADLREEFPQGADVFLANNVLAHVPDLNGFVAGIRTVLNDNGVAVIEAPYLVDLVDHCEFDTIYHQHLCYFSITGYTDSYTWRFVALICRAG
jgi:SAM-dependent methyltransferase